MNEHHQNRIFALEESSNKESVQKKLVFKGNNKFPWITTLLIIVVMGVILAVAVLYQFNQKKPETAKNDFFSKEQFSVTDDITRKIQLPEINEIPDSIELIKAIKLYKAGYSKAAAEKFADIVENSDKSDELSFAYLYLGIIADNNEEFSKAVNYYKSAIKYMPENFFAHYNLAIAYRHKGEYKEALNELEIAQKIKPEFNESVLMQGQLEYENNDLTKAEETLENLVEKSEDALSLYNLGMVYKKEGKLAEAKAVFLKAIDMPGSPEAIYKSAAQLGVLFGAQGDFENSEIYFKKAIELNPSESKYYYNLALVQSKLGLKEDAIATLKKVFNLKVENPGNYVYISRLYQELGDMVNAEKALRYAKEAYPLDVEILSQLSDVLIVSGKWNEALMHLKKILDITNKTSEKANALYNLGKVYTELGDFENGKKALELSFQLDNTNSQALISLGNLHYANGEGHKAIGLYKQALKNNPDDVVLLKGLSNLYINLKLYVEAEEALGRLLEHPLKNDLDTYWAYISLGKIEKQRKNFDRAVEYFEKVVKSGNSDYTYEGLIELSDSLLKADRPASAAYTYIEKAVAIKPDQFEARLLLSKAYIKDGSLSATERAEEELETIVNMARDPVLLSKAHTLRGVLYHKQGISLKALEEFKLALDFDPTNQEAFLNRKSIQRYLDSN